MPPRAKPQPKPVNERDEMMAKMAAIIESQQKIIESLQEKAEAKPGVEDQKREADYLATCPRVTVFHAGEEPQRFRWNAAHTFVIQPGKNENVPIVFAKMYDDWVATRKDGEARAKLLSSNKTFDQQQALLNQTKVPMR